MKQFILLHNQVTMAQASIMHSVEGWKEDEIKFIKNELNFMIDNVWLHGDITEYQRDKLHSLVTGIESFNK